MDDSRHQSTQQVRMKHSLCPASGSNPAKSSRIYKPANSSVIDRMKHLLSTGTGADCQFLVGKKDGNKELLSAHKLILLSASDVFEAMFRFDDQNAKKPKNDENSSPVEIIDVEPDAFKAMLSFIYADDLNGLNGDNVVSLLYAANKYNIGGLINACIDFPMPKLQNIFRAISDARNIGQEDFAHQCLELVDQNANKMLQSEQFLQIGPNLFYEILERDQLRINGEIAIWNAALRWADAQCRQNGIECSAANRRDVLGMALYKIRFPLIPQGDFTKHIAPLGVLTDQELVSVYRSYHSVADPPDIAANSAQSALYPLRFSTEHRALLSQSAAEALSVNKFKGNIEMKIKEFSTFLERDSKRHSSSNLHLAGCTWQIITQYNIDKPYLRVCLKCGSANKDGPQQSVKCSLTLRIVSQRKGKDDHCETSSRVFDNLNYSIHCWWGSEILQLDNLMDPQNGFYLNDTVILRVEIVVDKPPAAGDAVE